MVSAYNVKEIVKSLDERKFDYVQGNHAVRDMSTAVYGRKMMDLSEIEMPGLMACREEFGPKQPLKGVKIMGSLHMTIQTAVLIETLSALGAEVQWCSCNIFSTQDEAAAAVVAKKTAKVFAWKGETAQEYWWCTYQALNFGKGKGPDMIVDDGGDATLLIHEGVKFEALYAKDKSVPNPDDYKNKEMKVVISIIAQTLAEEPQKWTKMAKAIKGVSEETTTGVHRLEQMAKNGKLLFPAININDSVTKSKFDNIYGCRHSLPDGIMRATDVMIAGKVVLVAGYGDVGKGCVQAMHNAGARVLVAEIDPICALQACMEGFKVTTVNDAIGEVDIIITATGNCGVVTLEHMKKMKNNAIIGNIGHFDTEIDWEGLLEEVEAKKVKRNQIKAGVLDSFKFEDGHNVLTLAEGRLLNLGCATGHPSFVMSCSFTNQVVAQLELWKEKDNDTYSTDKVWRLPKILDEKVARLHLDKLGAKLTKLTDEQSEYLHIPTEGPYKPLQYRY